MLSERVTKLKINKLCGRFVLILFLLTPMISTACSQVEGGGTTSPSSTYQQVNILLPEGMQHITSLETIQSGELWLIGQVSSHDTFSSSLWELKDDNTWEEKISLTDQIGLDEGDILLVSAIIKSGEVLCIVYNEKNLQEGLKFYHVDFEHDAGYRELDIDTTKFLGSLEHESLYGSAAGIFSLTIDRFLIQNSSNSLFILDITNETITPVPIVEESSPPTLLSAVELNEGVFTLYEETDEGEHSTKLKMLDVKTGIFSDLNNTIKDEVEALLKENDKDSYLNVSSSMESGSNPSERITLCLNNGIYEYSNNKLKKIVDVENTVLSDPAELVIGCIFNNREDFYLLSWSTNTQEAPYSLYKYEITNSLPDTSSSLRVYALEDNAEVRQAITIFKEKYSDVEVTLEIGLSSENLTTDDAIRNLNTEFMAGNGPDVLFIDGLPMESYVEQGILHNLFEVYSEAIDSGRYYENIVGAYAAEDECWAIPTRFTFPLALAEKNILRRIDSLPALVSVATEMNESNPGSPLFCNMEIYDDLFTAYYPELINQDGLDRDALISLFENTEQLFSTLEQNNNQGSVLPRLYYEATQETNGTNDHSAAGRLSLYESPNQLLVFQPLYEQEFGYNEVIIQNIETDITAGILSLNQKNCYLPRINVAVNRNSNELELSEAFIQVMLSEEYQGINHGEGLSIMKSVFMDAVGLPFGIGFEDGNELFIEAFSGNLLDSYQSLFVALDTPVTIDRVVQLTIFEELERFLGGEISKEEAVDACFRKLEIYFTE